jgi:hypothetical protein
VEARLTKLDKALKELHELRAGLASPRTRYRTRATVVEAVETLLRDCEAAQYGHHARRLPVAGPATRRITPCPAVSPRS